MPGESGLLSERLSNLDSPATILARHTSLDPGPLCKTGDMMDGALPIRLCTAGFGNADFYPNWSAGDGLFDLSYCGYSFDLTGFDAALEIAYSWDTAPAHSGLVYLGAGNFARDVWEWYAAPTNGTVTLSEIAPYRSTPGNTMFVMVVCLGTEEIFLNNIRIGNLPPTAQLTADEGLGLPGEVIHFDASASSDEDGKIAKYLWDPEGDGTYIPLIFGTGSPTRTVTYSMPGDFSPTVKIIDDSGAEATASVDVDITMGNFLTGILDNNFEAGRECCAAAIDNYITAAYMQGSNLCYIHALDHEGYNWPAPVIVDSSAEGTPSLAAIGGRPAIAYQSGSFDLGYVRANNAAGSSWPVPVIAVAKYDVFIGINPSLTEIGSLPAIAYCDAEYEIGGTTWYVRANDLAGASWKTPRHLSSGGASTADPSLALINGTPMVSYTALDGYDPIRLDFYYASDTLGDSWNSPVNAITSGGPIINKYALVDAAGKPALGYYDKTADTLMFVRAANAAGSSWGDASAIDETSEAWGHSFAVIHGLPCVAYGAPEGGLKYIIAKTSTGSDWNEPITVDANTTIGGLALISIYDLPAFVWFDAYERELRFAIYN